MLLSETEDCIMTLSNMLLSPHVSDFRADIENWVHLLQELGNYVKINTSIVIREFTYN